MQDVAETRLDALADAEPGRGFLVSLLALTFLMNTAGRGVTETFAVFLLPVEAALGVSRAEISATYSIYMLAHGLSAPFAGQLIDRLGARVTYAFGLLCLAAGYLVAAGATSLPHYILGVGVMGGLGAASLGMVAASSLLSRWFTRRIGMIMALPYAAVGIGMLLLPPLTQLLLATMDWRGAHRVLGFGVAALLPLAMLFPLRRMTAGSQAWRAQRSADARGGGSVWPLSAAARTGAFWGLFAAYFFTSVAAYSVMPHSVAYLVESGFDKLAAAGAFGFTGLLSAIGIVVMGGLSDRIGRQAAATLSYCSTMIGITALVLVSVWPAFALVYAFVLFFGLMQGARGPIIVALVADLFRGGSVGSIFGTLSLALGLGAGLGSWGSGLLYQWTGNYVASFSVGIAAAFCGMAMFWLVPSLRHGRLASAEPHRR